MAADVQLSWAQLRPDNAVPPAQIQASWADLTAAGAPPAVASVIVSNITLATGQVGAAAIDISWIRLAAPVSDTSAAHVSFREAGVWRDAPIRARRSGQWT